MSNFSLHSPPMRSGVKTVLQDEHCCGCHVEECEVDASGNNNFIQNGSATTKRARVRLLPEKPSRMKYRWWQGQIQADPENNWKYLLKFSFQNNLLAKQVFSPLNKQGKITAFLAIFDHFFAFTLAWKELKHSTFDFLTIKPRNSALFVTQKLFAIVSFALFFKSFLIKSKIGSWKCGLIWGFAPIWQTLLRGFTVVM